MQETLLGFFWYNSVKGQSYVLLGPVNLQSLYIVRVVNLHSLSLLEYHVGC